LAFSVKSAPPRSPVGSGCAAASVSCHLILLFAYHPEIEHSPWVLEYLKTITNASSSGSCNITCYLPFWKWGYQACYCDWSCLWVPHCCMWSMWQIHSTWHLGIQEQVTTDWRRQNNLTVMVLRFIHKALKLTKGTDLTQYPQPILTSMMGKDTH